MVQCIICYDFVDNDGLVHPNQKTPPMNRDEANKMWVQMKENKCFQNMRPEKIEAGPVRHVVDVTFSGKDKYTYETIFAIKKGNYVVIETEYFDPYTGRKEKVKKVVQAISDDHDESEESIIKRFPLERLKPIFGIVKTK